MKVRRLLVSTAAVGLLGGSLGACFPFVTLDEAIEFWLFGTISGQPVDPFAKPAKPTRLEPTMLNVLTDLDIGGLSGTYTIGLGDYGTFSGTATIKGGRKVKLTSKDEEAVMQVFEQMYADAFGLTVDIQKEKGVVKAEQTPGGVEIIFKTKYTVKGVVTAGPDAGRKISGKITAKDRRPRPGG
jgi:hypothetical protein